MQKNTFSNNIVYGSSQIHRPRSPLNIPSDCVPSDKAFEIITDDLINDAVLDFCFQVQRASRVWLFRNEVDDNVENQTEDIFGQKKGNIKVSRVNCPYCETKLEARRFAQHLETKCKPGSKGQRTRKATKRTNIDTLDSDLDEDDDVESDDTSYGSSSKKKSKNKTRKPNNRKRAPKNPLTMSTASYESLKKTFGSYEQVFSQYCGVRSKRTNKICIKSTKCSQHAEELKIKIRNEFMPNCIAESSDTPIDVVDNVEEEPSAVDLSQSISKGSSPEFLINSE